MSLRKRSSSDDEGKAPRKRPNILLTSSDNVVEEKNGSDNRKLDRSESPLLAPLLTELHQIFVPGALPPRLTAFASVDLSILAEVLRPCSGCTTLTNCNAGTGTCHDCYTKKEVCSVPTFLRYWIYSDRTGLTLEQTLFMITNYGDHKTKKSFCLDNTVFSNHLRQVVEKSLLPPPLNTGTSVLGDSPTDLENRVKALNLRRSPVVRTVHALENHRPRELLSRDLLTHSQPSSSMAQSHWLYSRSHTELISPIHETPVRVIQAAGHRHFQFVTSTSSSPSENPSSTQCTLCSHSDARFSGPPYLYYTSITGLSILHLYYRSSSFAPILAYVNTLHSELTTTVAHSDLHTVLNAAAHCHTHDLNAVHNKLYAVLHSELSTVYNELVIVLDSELVIVLHSELNTVCNELVIISHSELNIVRHSELVVAVVDSELVVIVVDSELDVVIDSELNTVHCQPRCPFYV
ncbi:uncharacterized protein C8R40DRAFT_1178647 [Lentinula edodes]|uniref:uncharacterized protein n=1 Tax=Lentinula edodes TaxID=5353 RepID=UPI001E8ED6F4|nr:uncharacterized protein C8R40DRAFT_1178647 [Lentinula edodes]KAH7867755.1 hypothetical protein C8R40DRAFT_1178647 [Lentinula edodes]